MEVKGQFYVYGLSSAGCAFDLEHSINIKSTLTLKFLNDIVVIQCIDIITNNFV